MSRERHGLPRRIAIETSTRPGSVAIAWGSDVFEAPLDTDGAHAADLLPALDALIERIARARPRATEDASGPEGIVVGVGPGSFTGVRVGIATAIALARAWNVGVVGVPSFEALALDALDEEPSVTVAADARAGRVYFARYERATDGPRCAHPPAALRWSELDARLVADELVLADAGVAARLRDAHATALRLREGTTPGARALLELGSRRLARGERDEAVEPLYLFSFGER